MFHFEFHAVLEALKDTYAAVDPDSATRRPDGNAPVAPVDVGTIELLARVLVAESGAAALELDDLKKLARVLGVKVGELFRLVGRAAEKRWLLAVMARQGE